MKVIHGSLKGLLTEVKGYMVEVVRVAAFMQSEVVANVSRPITAVSGASPIMPAIYARRARRTRA